MPEKDISLDELDEFGALVLTPASEEEEKQNMISLTALTSFSDSLNNQELPIEPAPQVVAPSPAEEKPEQSEDDGGFFGKGSLLSDDVARKEFAQKRLAGEETTAFEDFQFGIGGMFEEENTAFKESLTNYNKQIEGLVPRVISNMGKVGIFSDEETNTQIITSGGTLPSDATTKLGKIGEAIKEQAILSFSEVGLEEETVEGLSNVAEFLGGPISIGGVPNPLRAATDLTIVGGGALIGTTLEALGAIIETGLVGTAQIVAESTGNTGDGVQFIRDVGMPLIVFGMFAAGGAGPRSAVPKAPKTVDPILGLKGEKRPSDFLNPKNKKTPKDEPLADPLQIEGEVIKDITPKNTATEKVGFDGIPEHKTIGQHVVENSKSAEKLSPEVQAEAAARLDNALEEARLLMGEPAEIISDTLLTPMQIRIFEVQNSLLPIRESVVKSAEELELAPDMTIFRNSELLNGLNDVIEAMMKRGTPQLVKEREMFMVDGKLKQLVPGDLKFNDRSLEGIFEPLKHGKIKRWLEYKVGLRANELMQQGREKLFDQEQIDALINIPKEDVALFEQQRREFNQFNEDILQLGVDMGSISIEMKDALLASTSDFISFRRVVEGKGGGGKNTFIKKLIGKDLNIRDPFENILKNPSDMLEFFVINKVKADILVPLHEQGFTLPNGLKLVTKEVGVTAEFISAKVKLVENIIKEFEAKGVEISEIEAKKLAEPFTSAKPLGRNQEAVFVDGKREIFTINDPYLVRSVELLGPKSLHPVFRVLSIPTNVLRAGVVMTAEFSMRNLFRDMRQAVLLAETTNFTNNPFRNPSLAGFKETGKELGGVVAAPIIVFKNTLKGLRSRWNKDDNYWLNAVNGGGFASLYKGEVMSSKRLRNRLTEAGIKPSNVFDSFSKAFSNFFGITEEGVRLGEFESILARGEGAKAGAIGARTVSTDFGLRGANDGVRNVLSLLPFVNARGQGIVRVTSELRDNPVSTAVKGFTAITLPALALYAYNKDQQDYKDLPDWVKDNYYVILREKKGDMVLIPKEFEAGAIFATVPERLFEMIEMQHGRAFAEALMRIITDQLSFDIRPQFIKPVMELQRNEGFFGQIVPDSLEEVVASDQFTAFTSESMVALARLVSDEVGVEISPIQTEFLIRGYLGSWGGYLLDASDSLVRSINGDVSPTMRLEEMPVVKAFMREQPIKRTGYEDSFYDLLSESRLFSNTVQKMLNEGRKVDAEKLIFEKDILFGLQTNLETTAAKVAGFNNKIKIIIRNDDMTADEKRVKIDKLIEARNKIFRASIQALDPDFAKQNGITQ